MYNSKNTGPIVVIGCQGQLGWTLHQRLGQDGNDDRIVGLDMPKFDLTNRQAVLKTICNLAPCAVINTAAYTLVDRAEEEPEACRLVNVQGTANLVDACRLTEATLVQISTDYVFGTEPTPRTPIRESAAMHPLGVYAKSKCEAEEIVAEGLKNKHLIVRTCGLFGNGGSQANGNFVLTMLRLTGEIETIRVVDDQLVTPSYVPDVARAIAFLLRTKQRGIFHVVNSGATTWHGFASELFRQKGLEVNLEGISTQQYNSGRSRRVAPRPSYSVLSTEKYNLLPGRFPLRPWQEALTAYLVTLA